MAKVAAVTKGSRRTKSLQDIVDQRTRIRGYEGGRYSTYARQRRATQAFERYANNMAQMGAFSNPNQQYRRSEYTK